MSLLHESTSDPLEDALALGQFGVAFLGEALTVERRLGLLSGWLPEEGGPACASPLLLGMEDSLEALRENGGEITLPSLRLPARIGALDREPLAPIGSPGSPGRCEPGGSRSGDQSITMKAEARLTISIRWRAPRYVVVTTPDHGGEQIDRLLASGRREKQLLQQQAEAASARMRVADALYRDIVETAGDLVLRFGADLKIVFANRLAARFLGQPQDALTDRAIHDLFPALGQDNPWRLDMAAEKPASFEIAARDGAGALRWLWWDVRVSGDGEFQAVARDVTDARRLRAERDKAQEEARAAAVANERLRIAHDLHDTLARSMVTLIAQTRLIGKTTSDPRAKESLAEMEREARKGLQEVREALTQMRAERRGEDDWQDIVDAFAARLRETRQIDLRADIAAAGDMPRETRELFTRVLREAMRNVELHSGARRVSIDLRRRGSGFELDILDDGVGFDPDAPAPGHYGVTGMRERARLAGAKLEIVSAVGRGARVTLREG